MRARGNAAPGNVVMRNAGGKFAGELTVMLTAAEVVAAPKLSVARAVIECVPAATLLQVMLYGAVVSVPIKLPSPKKSTLLVAPSGSEAAALIEIVAGAVKVAPLTGEVTLTAGGWLMAPLATILM